MTANRYRIVATQGSWSGHVGVRVGRHGRRECYLTQFDANIYECSRESAAIILRQMQSSHPGYDFRVVETVAAPPERPL